MQDISGVGERVRKEGDEQDGAQEEEEIDAEAAEDAPVEIARDPGDPTPGDREHHNATHIPYRSWCPVCVSRARAKKRATEGKNAETKVANHTCALTAKTFGQEGDYDDKATVLVCKDEITKMKFAHKCERKGATKKWAIENIIEDIDRLGYTAVILKGDGEPALQEVL